MKKQKDELNTESIEDSLKIIGFRLDPDSREALLGRASQRGISIHDLARIYVLEALHAETERTILEEGFGNLRQQLRQQQMELGKIAYALLIGAGKLKEDQAREWVQKNISIGEKPAADE